MDIYNIRNFNINPNYNNHLRQNFNGLFKSEKDCFIKTSTPQADFDKKIKRATMGKYQKEFLSVFNSPEIKSAILKQVEDKEISEEDMLKILKDLSTSTFKIAMDKPDNFINHSLDGKYKIYRASNAQKSSEMAAKGYIQELFKENFIKIFNALKIIDTDTLNQMLDKRSNSFSSMLNDLDGLDDEHLKLLSELIKKVQQGRAAEKIKLCQIVSIFQDKNLDISKLDGILKDGKVSTDGINSIFNELLCELLPDGAVDKAILAYAKFNEEYLFLLFKKDAFRENAVPNYPSREFNSIMQSVLEGKDFMEFIQDETNFIGQTNAKTKALFEQNNIDYDKWLKTDIAPQTFKSQGKTMKVQLWDRNPCEDLFIGNKTRCCTAIGTGTNSAAMPIFLANTSFNYVEVKDEQNNTKGMARIYFSTVEDKPAVIIDSIELADNHTLSKKEKVDFRNNIFEYVKNFSNSVDNDNPSIYFIAEDAKVPVDDLTSEKLIKTSFIGDVSTNRIYTNAASGFRWSDIRDSGFVSLYKIA